MSSYMAKTDADGIPSNFEQQWFVIDATDQVVGRLAATVATIIRGKHKPVFTPHCDTGDFVIIINCDKVKFTGRLRLSRSIESEVGSCCQAIPRLWCRVLVTRTH